ncbi:MAG: hypothetical protein HY909_17950 [Deltaproteobacteria bacterium]|nr:hypothetical protein [Deltaproteobacteria bacterium]
MRRRLGVGLGLVAVAALVALGLARRSPAPPTAPSEVLAWLPEGAPAAVALDLPRLRQSPHLSPWLSDRREGCERDLLARVRALGLMADAVPVRDFAVVALGELPRDALLRCARARAGGGVVPAPVRVHGLEGTRLRAPGSEAEVLWLPGAILAGHPRLVQGMVDKALTETYIPGRAAGWERLPSGWMARGVFRVTPEPGGAGPLAEVRALGVGLDLGGGLVGEAWLQPVEPSRAEAVGERVRRWFQGTARALEDPSLRALAEGAVVDARGGQVRVRLTLGDRALTALLGGLATLATGSPEPVPPSPR